jgi:hypothetical protein
MNIEELRANALESWPNDKDLQHQELGITPVVDSASGIVYFLVFDSKGYITYTTSPSDLLEILSHGRFFRKLIIVPEHPFHRRSAAPSLSYEDLF